jgi:hypothetical protein
MSVSMRRNTSASDKPSKHSFHRLSMVSVTSKTVGDGEKRTMVISDVADEHALNVETKPATATRFRPRRFVIRLNGEFFGVSENHMRVERLTHTRPNEALV